MHPAHTMDDVRECLGGRRLAFVGLSTDPESFSRSILQELASRRYEVVPVHPTAATVAGRPACRSLTDLERPVSWALVMTPAAATADAVRDVLAAGVRRLWIHRGVGQGSVTREAVELAAAQGATVIAGECVAMYLDNAAWFHRAHRWVRQATGSAPREVPSQA